MNKFFGYEGNSYSIILTDLQPFNYGIYFNDNDMLKIYSILSINRSFQNDQEYSESSSDSLTLNLIIHEFSHPYVNPLTEKHIEKVNSYKAAYDKLLPYKLPCFYLQ